MAADQITDHSSGNCSSIAFSLIAAVALFTEVADLFTETGRVLFFSGCAHLRQALVLEAEQVLPHVFAEGARAPPVARPERVAPAREGVAPAGEGVACTAQREAPRALGGLSSLQPRRRLPLGAGGFQPHDPEREVVPAASKG